MKSTARTMISAGMLLAALAGFSGPSLAAEYPPETNYDTSVGPDEALVNLRVRNSRWPDCYSLETIVRDIFRIEGVGDPPDATPEKAMALWTWVHMLKSTGGSRVFEGAAFGKRRKFTGNKRTDQIEVRRGDKQLLVYGVHECGGMSRTMAHLWRAAGFLGYQVASRGHSTAAFRYPDHKDGIWRMHAFNPQGHSYYWDPKHNRVGTRRLPVMRGVEYRRFVPPLTHTLRTSLRTGEVVVRKWKNDGYIQKTKLMLRWAGEVGNNKRHFRANVAGQEDQTLTADTDPKTFKNSLWQGADNVVCSPPKKDRAVLHPAEAGKTSSFIYRLPSAGVAIEAIVEADLVKTAGGDVCRLSFSTDLGKTWDPFYEKKEVGTESVKIELGQKRYWNKQPSITSYYNLLVKAEFKTGGAADQVGMNAFKVTVHRQFNMRCRPNLMPKENVLKISADSIRPGLALKFKIAYEVNGKPKSVTEVIAKFPHYLKIDIDGLPKDKLKNDYYLTKFGGSSAFNLPEHPLRMHALQVELVPLASAKLAKSMPAEEAEPFFKKKYPNPHKRNNRMANKKKIPQYESQVSGFFPQVPRPKEFPTNSRAYYEWMSNHNIGGTDTGLPKIGKDVEDAVAWCIKKFPKAHHLHTVGLCNVFAHFKDKRAIPVLLAKWKKAPANSPGDRYIPDALAAIGDPSVVPALVKRIKELRMSHRVHIARALGILGGEEARKALEMMAKEDPNISVRGEAKRALEAMKKK